MGAARAFMVYSPNGCPAKLVLYPPFLIFIFSFVFEIVSSGLNLRIIYAITMESTFKRCWPASEEAKRPLSPSARFLRAIPSFRCLSEIQPVFKSRCRFRPILSIISACSLFVSNGVLSKSAFGVPLESSPHRLDESLLGFRATGMNRYNAAETSTGGLSYNSA